MKLLGPIAETRGQKYHRYTSIIYVKLPNEKKNVISTVEEGIVSIVYFKLCFEAEVQMLVKGIIKKSQKKK